MTATGIAAGDVAGIVWFLDWPASWGPAHIAGPLGDAVRALPTELRQLRPASDLAARVVATSDRQRLRSTSSAWISSDSHTPPHGPPGQPVRRHVILFLAANPSGTSRLALDEECAAIERELRMTTGRDDFDFRSKWAVSVDEMMRHLNELQPTILHFSGHGGGSAHVFLQDQPSRQRDLGVAASAAIQLQGEQREPQHVSPRALSQMIRSAAPSTRVVVLNACFTDAMVEALCGSVDCVVGMRGAIGDDAARSFAVGFYRALGYRRSVGNAIAQAVATLAAKQLPDEHLPVYRIRDGIRADQVFLADLGPRPPDPAASRAAMTRAMRGCDTVFHAAAHVEEHGPLETFMAKNVTGTENARAAARAGGVRRFVHVGTEAVLADGKPIEAGLAEMQT